MAISFKKQKRPPVREASMLAGECEVLRLASRARREPRHRGNRHRRDKGEAHQEEPTERAPNRSNRPVHPAPRLPPIYVAWAVGWRKTCSARSWGDWTCAR